ncbi:unnamed protein product [Onchocerca ochengi]|uniref:Uncharacterized protein n=1 Tax=Onchocerca ochengi TaxID=42157 RepID=A0A182E6R8_ONCOC|nr:unnamed protein product [Onchocerca ochengi]
MTKYYQINHLRRTIQHEQPESNGTISEMVYSSIGESSPLRLVGEQRSNQASIWNQSGIQHGSNQRHPL